MWKKYGRDRHALDDDVIVRMRTACWITKATDTHSEYVILIDILQQQCLRAGASVFGVYMHCRSCLTL